MATVVALNAGIIPQTLNFRGADPECELEYCHSGNISTSAVVALSNSFAFGGNITSLVLGL
jgi:3-oxoacyl-[acyl-carrier-protein] synthase II